MGFRNQVSYKNWLTGIYRYASLHKIVIKTMSVLQNENKIQLQLRDGSIQICINFDLISIPTWNPKIRYPESKSVCSILLIENVYLTFQYVTTGYHYEP